MSDPRAPLANVDSAWLRMDDPTNLMVVTGVLMLESPVPVEQVRALVIDRLLRFPRFKQRVVDASTLGTPSWEADPDFSVDHHVVAATLPGAGGEADLQRFVSARMSEPFDATRPLWQFHVVPYSQGTALVGRIHHCIGDGLALIYVMLTLADGGSEPPSPAPSRALQPADEVGDGLLDAMSKAVAPALSAAASVSGALLQQASDTLANPKRFVTGASQASAAVGTLARLLTLKADPPTRLRGPLVSDKKVVWSHALPVEDLKRVGRRTGSTINDILMSAVAGALRRYLLADGGVDATLNVRGVIPVNLRPIEDAHKLGNQFGLVFLDLPLGIGDPLERLFEVRKRMNALKKSPEAYLVFQLLRAIGIAPRPIFDLVVGLFGKKATAVVTNVIGPREPISLMGARLGDAMFFVPCAGRLGLGISVLSYAGGVRVGVQTDAGLIPDPDRILDGFRAEVDALIALADEADQRAEQ